MGITPQQFERMKSRVAAPRRAAAKVFEDTYPSSRGNHRIVLGLDPSLRGTGFGVLRLARPQPVVVAQGTITIPSGWQRSRCLMHIAQALRGVIQQHQPSVCVIESLFYAQNLQT